MDREERTPRPDWERKVEELGFHFHTIDGVYWDERACYRFTAAEIDKLELATGELQSRCIEAVERVISRRDYARFRSPEGFHVLIERSWEADEKSLYGRFDLSWDGSGDPKMLEYNADTPTALLEASVVQWYWLIAAALSPGSRLIPILHNTLWPLGQRRSVHKRWIDSMLGDWFWSRAIGGALVVSKAARRQIESLARSPAPVIEFQPTFRAADVERAASSRRRPGTPFRVLFAGRVQRDKGAHDFVEMAAMLQQQAPGRFAFDICGDGSQAGEVAELIRRHALDAIMTMHGRLDRTGLVARYAAADLAVVPTRSNFREGFAMVVAEAVLLGCPVVTSPVVPASEYYPDAVVLARTDDPRSYAEQILALSTDEDRYRRLCDGCEAAKPVILDDSSSFQNGLRSLWRLLGVAGAIPDAPGKTST